MHAVPETRDSLLIRLRQPGNQEAWREFSSLYEPLILRLAARKGFQYADAQDLLQDVLLGVAKGIDRLEIGEDKGRFRGWLFRICRNAIVDALEKRRRVVVGSGDSDLCERLAQAPALGEAEHAAYIVEFRRELFHWAARGIRPEFQPATWNLFWKTSVKGAPIAETARQLGLSLGAAYAARCRVLARLRKKIEDLDDLAVT
jgi:RNA polymerase sigma-70 factor (ECF subfamily)